MIKRDFLLLCCESFKSNQGYIRYSRMAIKGRGRLLMLGRGMDVKLSYVCRPEINEATLERLGTGEATV